MYTQVARSLHSIGITEAELRRVLADPTAIVNVSVVWVASRPENGLGQTVRAGGQPT